MSAMLRQQLENVHAAFGEFVSAFVSTASEQTSVLDVSVIAAKDGEATVVCGEYSAPQTSTRAQGTKIYVVTVDRVSIRPSEAEQHPN